MVRDELSVLDVVLEVATDDSLLDLVAGRFDARASSFTTPVGGSSRPHSRLSSRLLACRAEQEQ